MRALLYQEGEICLLVLTAEKVEEITGHKRGKVLTQMGIRWQINAAGSLIVGRKHVERVLSGEISTPKERKKPNLQTLSA